MLNVTTEQLLAKIGAQSLQLDAAAAEINALNAALAEYKAAEQAEQDAHDA